MQDAASHHVSDMWSTHLAFCSTDLYSWHCTILGHRTLPSTTAVTENQDMLKVLHHTSQPLKTQGGVPDICTLQVKVSWASDVSLTQQALHQKPSQASRPGTPVWPILIGYALCEYHAGCCSTPCIRHVDYTPGLLQYRPVLLALHHLGPESPTLDHVCQRGPRHAQCFPPQRTAFKEKLRHA